MNAQWTYMDAEGRVVARQVAGGRVESMLASALPPNTEVLPYVAPPPLVPQSVSAFQGMMSLHQAGLLTTVQAYMDSPAASAPMKLAWQKAGDWERDSPTVTAMLQLLGLSAAQGDQLFITAKGIKA